MAKQNYMIEGEHTNSKRRELDSCCAEAILQMEEERTIRSRMAMAYGLAIMGLTTLIILIALAIHT